MNHANDVVYATDVVVAAVAATTTVAADDDYTDALVSA